MKLPRILIITLVLMISFFLGINFLIPDPEGFPILEYHQVTDTPLDPDNNVYNVPPAEFSKQLDYLQAEGYSTITLQDFMYAVRGYRTLPPKPIVLTFDDGYADNFNDMLPILEAHGMKAVVFVVINQLGKENYLTFEQVKEMQERGIEIGSHTSDHLALTTLDSKEQRRQIHESKIFLEWNGLKSICSFSYPNGEYNSEIIDLLRQENYLAAVTGDAGLNTLKTNPFKLYRVNIRKPHFGLNEFKFRLFKAKFFAKIRNILN